jgi:tartrate-resistant acid phosphatase type 5
MARKKMFWFPLTLLVAVGSQVLVFGGLAWWDSAPRHTSAPVESAVQLSSNLSTGEPSSEVRLLAFGDSGTGGSDQVRIAGVMEEVCKTRRVDGLLMLGDNFYMDGVSSVDDPQWQEKFEKPYGLPCLSQLNVYPVLGNHDYRLSPGAQIDYTTKNPRWRMPGRFWRVDFGDVVRVAGLDSNRFDICLSSQFCVFDFFLRQFPVQQEGPVWRIAMAHHPLASSDAKGRSHSGGVLGIVMKPFVCARVDMWLSGHAHLLERRTPTDCRAELIVSGGGGGDLGTLQPDGSDAAFVAPAFGFAELVFDRNEMRGSFINGDGQVLHSWQRSRGTN